MRASLLACLLVAPACGVAPREGDAPETPDAHGGQPDKTNLRDDDMDGIDDRQELAWAQAYLPYLSVSARDKCPTGGLIVRVYRHPKNRALLQLVYDHLYDDDCGLSGHMGDSELFGMTVDPRVAPPDGILAIKTISHQGTACERANTCGRCGKLDACQTIGRGGVPWPGVWSSRDKHGGYVNRQSKCTTFGTCLDSCDDNDVPVSGPIVNVGEPGHPLVRDLTTAGLISESRGWKHRQLDHYDPWGGEPFGNSGVVAMQLVDPALETPACP